MTEGVNTSRNDSPASDGGDAAEEAVDPTKAGDAADSVGAGWRRDIRRSLRKTAAYVDYFLSRSSRRRILPTFVFGRSSRNSMYFGCL